MSTTTTARHARLPIWRDANRLLVEYERTVRRLNLLAKHAAVERCQELGVSNNGAGT